MNPWQQRGLVVPNREQQLFLGDLEGWTHKQLPGGQGQAVPFMHLGIVEYNRSDGLGLIQ